MIGFGDNDERTRLDASVYAEESYRTLRRFAVTLAMILGWASVAGDRLPERGLAVLMVVAALTTAYICMLAKEPFCGPSLNRWDETLAFCCLAYLALLVA